MDKKNILTLVSILLVLIVFIIFVFSSLNQSKNNKETLNKANNQIDKTVVESVVIENIGKADRVEKKSDNIFCKKDKDCLSKIFLACSRGNGYFVDEKLNYVLIVNNKTEDKCNLSFMGIDSDNSKFSAYCSVDLKDINEPYFTKIISIKNLESDKNCSISK